MIVTMIMRFQIVFKMLSHWNLVEPSYKDRGLILKFAIPVACSN